MKEYWPCNICRWVFCTPLPWARWSLTNCWSPGVTRDSSLTSPRWRVSTRRGGTPCWRRQTSTWRGCASTPPPWSVNICTVNRFLVCTFVLYRAACSSGSGCRAWPPPGTWPWSGGWSVTSCSCPAAPSSLTRTSPASTWGPPSASRLRRSLSPPWRDSRCSYPTSLNCKTNKYFLCQVRKLEDPRFFSFYMKQGIDYRHTYSGRISLITNFQFDFIFCRI